MHPGFDTPLTSIFDGSIVKLDSWLIPKRQGHPREIKNQQSCVAYWIDYLGVKSAHAQKLKRPLTIAEKFMKTEDQDIYLYIDRQAQHGKGEAVGLLRGGPKNLYFHKDSGEVIQKIAYCIFDFYVAESRQRHGVGRQLCDFMLKDKGLPAYMLAIDRPSEQMLQFQQKHYGLTNLQLHANNYAVTPQFLEPSSQQCATPTIVQAPPVSRYAAHSRMSQIDAIIHGDKDY